MYSYFTPACVNIAHAHVDYYISCVDYHIAYVVVYIPYIGIYSDNVVYRLTHVAYFNKQVGKVPIFVHKLFSPIS